MRRMMTAVAFAASIVWTLPGAAQENYPARPISMVVPFAPGGPVDTVARLLAEPLREALGQPIVIENVAGAAGGIGVGRVVRAKPDGYTLSIGNWGTHVINNAMYQHDFDTVKDFEPIALMSASPQIFVAKKDFPANDLKSTIAWLKANPDKAFMALSGNGSSGHVAALLFQQATGTKFQFVPYRGLAPALQGVLAGEADILIDIPSNSVPHIKAGTVKGFAVMGNQRLKSAPDIPTVDEAGLPGFYSPIWYGIWAPKGTPKDIVDKLAAAIRKALATEFVSTRLAQIDQAIVPVDQQNPDYLRKYHADEMAKWGAIIKQAGLKANPN